MLNLTPEEALNQRDEIELLFVTATNTETEALQSALEPLSDIGDVAVAHIETHTYLLGRIGAFSVAHVQCVMGTRDAGAAMNATTDAVRCWNPRAVLMPGIAWGNPRVKNLCIGDVLVASSVQDFENARVGEVYQFRSPETQAGPTLVDRFRNVREWVFTLPDGRQTTFRDGLLLSGDKLIANATFRDNLLDQFTRAIGGDMESYGVAQACRARGVEWIVAKGVCDWGDETKDKTWQAAAARASVSLCVSVLNHSGALDGLSPGMHVESTGVQAPGVVYEAPNEIPAITDRLIGRDSEQVELLRGLADSSEKMSLSCILGMGGIGKTFLAAEAARQAFRDGVFPDGVVWIDTYERSATDVMTHVISALGGHAASLEPDAVQLAYRRVLRRRGALIVVDNALVANQITPLLTDEPGSAVLLTSRNHMPSLRRRASAVIDLGKMNLHDSMELLSEKSGLLAVEHTGPLRQIAEFCGHLPLALSIAGSLLAEREMWPSVESFKDQLQRQRLDSLTIEGSQDLDVRAVLALSYQRMDAALARVFRALSVLGRLSFGASAVSAVLDRDKGGVLADLARLVGRSVLERSSYGRYVMHDLLRVLADELLAADESVEEASTYRHRAAAYWADWHEALKLGSQAAASSRNGDCESAIADYERAQVINKSLDNRQGQAFAHGGLGSVFAQMGDIDRAIECYEKARALNEEIGNVRGQAADYGTLGAAYARGGEIDKAIECYSKAQVLNHKIGNLHGQAADYGTLAAVYAQVGRVDEAIKCYEEAQALNERIGDRHAQAAAFGGMGAAFIQIGEIDNAIECYGKAQSINREIGDVRGQARDCGTLGAAYVQLGNIAKAIECYAKAQELNERIGDVRGQAADYGTLAAVNAQVGETDKAIDCYQKAQALNQRIGDRHNQAAAYGGLGAVFAKIGDIEKAIECYKCSAQLHGELGATKRYAQTLGGLAKLQEQVGSLNDSLESFRLSLQANRTSKNRRGEKYCLQSLIRISRKIGNQTLEQLYRGQLTTAGFDYPR